ncbi:hypothetical protein MTR67_050862 [Solanum verrucosum]|uniref:Uncharacterized protein n=1 Tax=Solanum verrucosum TaxID=315347 RepID=A0AAF0V3S5_SOLVR|nr:hypothetical protein MTR67_050862 [Solanum verrucosum]
MRNYGNEQLNSKTSWVTCNSSMIRNIISKGLELKDTTRLKDAQIMKFMQNYGHERLDSRVYLTIRNTCIRLFSFSYLLPQSLAQIDS